MALPIWLETARNSLSVASNSYAEIQRQLDRYNKVFETYANASPETQIRAASVMRQALNEYMGLKKQQEENAMKIYEAQSWVDYYNNSPAQVQPLETYSINNNINQNVDFVRADPTEQVPMIAMATPWKLNNSAPTVAAENAIDTNTTMNVPVNSVFANANLQNSINPTTPAGVTNIINSQTPKYGNTTIKPVTPTYNVTTNKYWPGNVATIGTWGMVTTPWTNTWRRWTNIVRTRLK